VATGEKYLKFRCTECGSLHDVDVDLSGLVLPIGQRRGFAIEAAEVTFVGCCPMCAGETRRSSPSRARQEVNRRV